MILGSFVKQPADVLDYDVEYNEWLATGDTIESAVAEISPSGLTLDAVYTTETRIKVWLSGGTAGNAHKITVTATTADGRVKQDEFRIRVKDY